MKLADDVDLGQWWPVSPQGNAPEAFARALASLSPNVPNAIYCWSTPSEQEKVFGWHVLAVAGHSLLELHGAGPEGAAEESATRNGHQAQPTELSIARCHRLRDAVVGIRVLDVKRTRRTRQRPATDPWDVTWVLELATGELLTLPEPGTQSPAQIADAERLARAVLRHLQETAADAPRG